MWIIRKTQVISVLILVLTLISFVAANGCGGKNASTSSANNSTVFSQVDAQILTSSYADFDTLQKTAPLSTARDELVANLNHNQGVAKAHLGIDGYTIFIDYKDGDSAAIDTFSDTEVSPTSYAPSGGSSNSLDVSAAPFTEVSYKIPMETTTISELNPNPATPGSAKVTSTSKKVLILAPIGPEKYYYGWGIPLGYVLTKAPAECASYFAAHGWSDSDITLKVNTSSKPPGNMTVTPEDLFHIGDYGVFLFFGHGSADTKDEDGLYLECGTLWASTFAQEPYKTWKSQGLFKIMNVGTSVDGSETWYSLMIRADLLRQKIGTLPGTYVQLSTCYGWYFSKLFLDNGAGAFLGWDRKVGAEEADGNQTAMLSLMLGKDLSVGAAYQDSSVTQIIPSENEYKPLYDENDYITTTGTLGSEWSNLRPGATPTTTMTLNYSLHFMNCSTVDPDTIFLPAWVNLKVPVLPVGTSHLKVDILDIGKNRYITEDKALTPGQTSVEIDNFGDNCFPPGACSVKVSALDSKGATLLSNEAGFTLHGGANDLTMSVSKYQYAISGSQDPQTGISFSNQNQGVTAFDITLNGQGLGGASSNWTGVLGFNAQPGDVLEIRVWGTTGDYHPPGTFSTSLSPLWLTAWATGDQVKIIDGGNFSQYFNGAETVVLDVKFTIPGAKPSPTTTTPPSSTTVPSTTQTSVTSTPSTTPTPSTSPSGTVVPSTTTTSPSSTKAKLGELAYDDGAEDIWLSLGGTPKLGFLTRFTSDAPFVVNKIRIYSYMPTTPTPGSQFTIKITDGNLNPIWSVTLPFTLFTTEPSWLAIDVPNISTNGTFCVEVYAPSVGQGLGPYIGVDQSSANTHSEMISNFQLTQWAAQIPKETANFMIRAYSPDSTGIVSGIPHLTLSTPEISGLKVTINGITQSGTTNASITKIAWDWGDGTIEERWFPADHTYSKAGQFVVKVTAYQSDGITTAKSLTVTVQP